MIAKENRGADNSTRNYRKQYGNQRPGRPRRLDVMDEDPFRMEAQDGES